jgi:hypothetical protein
VKTLTSGRAAMSLEAFAGKTKFPDDLGEYDITR